MRIPLAVFVLPALAFTSACDVFSPRDERPHALWISDTGLVLAPGESFTFGALMQERGSRGRQSGTEHVPAADARWWTNRPDVLGVAEESDGTVEALTPGEAIVWVEVGARRDSATVSVRPPDAEQPTRRWAQVSTWRSTTCALDQSGDVYCWGSNAFGELGNGPRRFNTTTHRPVKVQAPARFVQVEVGLVFACGRTGVGEVWCWGRHGGAQLGHGRTSVDLEERPVRVQFDGVATALALGSMHACLLDSGGRAHCWGNNAHSQLGTGLSILSSAERGGRTLPVAFDGSFVSLTADSYATCGTTADREVYCWGLTYGGAPNLGLEVPVPSRITTPAEPTEVVPGDGGGCYRDIGGSVYCWGSNMVGQAGQPPTHQFSEFTRLPTKTMFDDRFSSIALSGGVTCGIDAGGVVQCWGGNPFGHLDPQLLTEQCDPTGWGCTGTPIPVPGNHRFRSLSIGQSACGITTADELYCWGDNSDGQLGIGRPQVEQTHIPQRVLDPR